MELTERFRYVMKLNSMTASKFADEIGVQRSSVSHILSGRNKPSLEFIQKVLKRFPKVDSTWLISGSISTSQDKMAQPTTTLVEHSAAVKEVEEQKGQVKINNSPQSNEPCLEKKIKKVLVFYNDGTFEEFSSAVSGTANRSK